MATYKFKIANLTGAEGSSCKITNFNNNRFTIMLPDGGSNIEPNVTNANLYWAGRTTVSCYLWDSNGGVIGSPLFYLSKAYHGSENKSVGIISYINENGVFVNYVGTSVTLEFTVSDTPSAGLESLSVTADSGINSILYNSVAYDTFPATIPLDPAATTMQVESKSPVLTINDGGNLKSVTYGSATFTKFPATVTATTPEFAVTARGKDSPVITVRTERTQSPVITNT